MDERLAWLRLLQALYGIILFLWVLMILIGVRIYQGVRTNRWLKSIDESLRMMERSGRLQRRAG